MFPTGAGGLSAQQMGQKRKRCTKFEDLDDNDYAILFAAHLDMFDKFMDFCKEKNGEYVQKRCDKNKFNLDGENQSMDKIEFKENLTKLFGEYLPAHVVNELCLLVKENSYGKCHYCSMPVESLVLSVLQILLDASQNSSNKAGSQIGSKILNNELDNSKSSSMKNHVNCITLNKEAVNARGTKEFGNQVSLNKNATRIPTVLLPNSNEELNNECHQQPPDEMSHGSGAIKSLMKKINRDVVPILDTPVIVLGNELDRNRSILEEAPFAKPSKEFVQHMSPEVQIIKEINFKARQSDSGRLTDQLYNQKNVNMQGSKNITHSFEDHDLQKLSLSSCRSPVSDIELRYYKVLCGLAHSQSHCEEGVKLFKTTVSYQSLGESIEPHGMVDDFFIAGYCRKLFDDEHPRQSRKHYFYPRIGRCLLCYSSEYEVNSVKNSFLGANTALKLHLADKLCFPVYKDKHWFAFIVDLKEGLFVFLDSIFSENHDFQIHARRSLIPAFKECWYKHSEVKLNLENFQVVYPDVPKQNNGVDCGIFAIMFMEFWGKKIDLRRFFGQSDIPNIRVRLGNALFFSKKNSVDKSLVQSFFQQGIDPSICN